MVPKASQEQPKYPMPKDFTTPQKVPQQKTSSMIVRAAIDKVTSTPQVGSRKESRNDEKLKYPIPASYLKPAKET